MVIMWLLLVGSVFGIPVPSGTLRGYSGYFSAAMMELVVCSSHNVVMVLGILQVLGYCPPVESTGVVL